jgi:hypothetical protein
VTRGSGGLVSTRMRRAGPANGNASAVGTQSAQITQNGQFVSRQDNAYGIDQTTTPGSRAALVQAALGH